MVRDHSIGCCHSARLERSVTALSAPQVSNELRLATGAFKPFSYESWRIYTATFSSTINIAPEIKPRRLVSIISLEDLLKETNFNLRGLIAQRQHGPLEQTLWKGRASPAHYHCKE